MYNPNAPRPILVPEMLPVTTWEQNVRHLMGGQVWDRMRRHAYRAAGYRCEICGASGPLEAHEQWTLSNETCVQKLTRIIALCPLDHKAHHMGWARRNGTWPAVCEQLKFVNSWSTLELTRALTEAREVWEQRCDWPWTVDLTWLQDQGYLYV